LHKSLPIFLSCNTGAMSNAKKAQTSTGEATIAKLPPRPKPNQAETPKIGASGTANYKARYSGYGKFEPKGVPDNTPDEHGLMDWVEFEEVTLETFNAEFTKYMAKGGNFSVPEEAYQCECKEQEQQDIVVSDNLRRTSLVGYLKGVNYLAGLKEKDQKHVTETLRCNSDVCRVSVDEIFRMLEKEKSMAKDIKDDEYVILDEASFRQPAKQRSEEVTPLGNDATVFLKTPDRVVARKGGSVIVRKEKSPVEEQEKILRTMSKDSLNSDGEMVLPSIQDGDGNVQNYQASRAPPKAEPPKKEGVASRMLKQTVSVLKGVQQGSANTAKE